MRFRLTYDGDLRPTQRDPINDERDPLAAHKHRVRRHFHAQLKQLWATNKSLRKEKMLPNGPDIAENIYGMPMTATGSFYEQHPNARPMAEILAEGYKKHGYRFVPLVRDDLSLLCSLSVLFLRRDFPGSVIQAGDIDNRIKTLVDALRIPHDALELVGNEQPLDGEDPFYCLMEDDKQVTHFDVETDMLLDAPTESNADQRQVRLVITVDLRPYNVTMKNLGFA